MYRVGLTALLLSIFSCSQQCKKSNEETPHFYYVGTDNIEKNLEIFEPLGDIQEQIILYSLSEQAKSNKLIKTLSSKHFNIKQFCIDRLPDDTVINSGKLLVFLLIENNNSDDINNAGHFIFKNWDRISKIIASSNAPELFFKKIASSFEYETLTKVGVDQVKISNGLNLIDLPVILLKSSIATRFPAMLSASLQNPSDYVICVDDSTSFSIYKNLIKVYGKGQMFIVKHPEATTRVDNGLFGGDNLQVSVFLPGDSVIIK